MTSDRRGLHWLSGPSRLRRPRRGGNSSGNGFGIAKDFGISEATLHNWSKWVSVTREVGSEAPVKTSPKEIREWAISEGHEVLSRGGFRPSSSEPSVMLR